MLADEAAVDSAGAGVEDLDEDELRETTVIASRTIPTITAIITRLDDFSFDFFRVAAEVFGNEAALDLGSEFTFATAPRVEVPGTGGIMIEADEDLLADFFALFLTAFLTAFLADFLTAFLALFLTADFFKAFVAEVFLTAFLTVFLTAFLAVFFALFFTATFSSFISYFYGKRIAQ